MAGEAPFDLLIIGGGINGVGIARDAAGRGLSVLLLERGDLAGATSSASSKLIHGGLRYLEQGALRLVRESLAEREVLLAAAPHLVRPLRFVLPVLRGARPAWMLRLGLMLYDHLGGRERLAPARRLTRGRDAELEPLQTAVHVGFEYSDCWTDDARLVVTNAIDARERGARIEVGAAFQGARREGALWRAQVSGGREVCARAVVNAAGPWVQQVQRTLGRPGGAGLRRVKGSHIVVPRLYAPECAYTLQNSDGRIIFTIPYEDEFTLVGTTDIPFEGDPERVEASAAEVGYLCAAAERYLTRRVSPAQVCWSYAGVRPLHDSGELNASTVTRDYAFDLDAPPRAAPLLSVYGGKLTTYRRLAEHALAQLGPRLGARAAPWTRRAVLPGGDLANADLPAFVGALGREYPALPAPLLARLAGAYGTRIERVLGGARNARALGEEIAPGLYEAELQYLATEEWARTAEDVLWRRSKLGLRSSAAARERVAAWLARHSSRTPTAARERQA